MALGMSLRRLDVEVDSEEMTRWVAYYQLEPFGELRADYRIAMLSVIVGSMFSKKGKGPKLADFLMDDSMKPRPQTPKEMAMVFEAYARAHNAWNRRGKKWQPSAPST